MAAATPRGSSTGSFGCSRIESRPGSPSVLRKAVVTRHWAATAIRSCSRMILLTPAAISGVRPGRSAASAAGSAASSQSRKPPTVRWAIGAKAGGIMPVEDEAGDLVRLVGHHRLIEEMPQRQVGQRPLGGDALGRGLGRQPRQHVARAQRRGPGQQDAEIGECVAGAPHRLREAHGCSPDGSL